MNKNHHSKYRNTGVIFELLIRQITSDTIAGKDSNAVNIIKKYFNKSELLKEHKLYQILINSKSISENKAESLINTTLDLNNRLNKTILRKEKYSLIKEIKDNYNLEEFFKAKINNYKEYASIFNLFELSGTKDFVNPSSIVSNKNTLLEYMSYKEPAKDVEENLAMNEYMTMDKGTRLLIYRLLLEKFNSKYSNLSVPQKLVLKEFIMNISNNIKLKEFVNEQYTDIRKQLLILTPKVTDETTKIKLKEIVNLIQPLNKNQNIKDDDIATLLQFHQLITDLEAIK